MRDRSIVTRDAAGGTGGSDGLFDSVPAGSPLQTAQLIGSLVIRFVMFAEAGGTWATFPDKPLLDAILDNCKDRDAAERHLVALLFHHSKILDNCGSPEPKLRRLTREAFPKVLIEDAKWEIIPE